MIIAQTRDKRDRNGVKKRHTVLWRGLMTLEIWSLAWEATGRKHVALLTDGFPNPSELTPWANQLLCRNGEFKAIPGTF